MQSRLETGPEKSEIQDQVFNSEIQGVFGDMLKFLEQKKKFVEERKKLRRKQYGKQNGNRHSK